MNETLDITVTKTEQTRLTVTDFSQLPFGKVFSDHMFIAEYENGEWTNLQVLPYGPILMSPAISALHYGQAIFEGMKAYRLADGKVSVFRPEKNFERFNKSATRMAMPSIPQDIFMQGGQPLIQKWYNGSLVQALQVTRYFLLEYLVLKGNISGT